MAAAPPLHEPGLTQAAASASFRGQQSCGARGQTVSVGAHLRALPNHATAHETFGPVPPIDTVPTETDAYGNAFGMDATAPDETGAPIMQADGPPVPGEDGAVVGRRLGDKAEDEDEEIELPDAPTYNNLADLAWAVQQMSYSNERTALARGITRMQIRELSPRTGACHTAHCHGLSLRRQPLDSIRSISKQLHLCSDRQASGRTATVATHQVQMGGRQPVELCNVRIESCC